MRTTVKHCLLLAVLGLCQTSFAQDSKMTVSQIDSLPAIIRYYLQETTSKHFEDPHVPRFLLRDRSDNFVFGVGGSIEGKMYYDYDGNRTNSFQMTKDGDPRLDNDVIDFTMHNTSLVFKVLGKTKHGVIDGLVSVNYNAAEKNIDLTQAYIELFGLKVGKTNTGFRDDESMDLVDGNALLSTTARKVPQISYSYKFKNGLRAQVGIEFPQSTSIWAKGDGIETIVNWNILMPDLTANLYYTGERFHFHVGADTRFINYYDDNVKYSAVPCCALQAGMNWAMVKSKNQTHKLFAQAIWSHGMADCCNSMRDQGLSVVSYLSSSEFLVPNIMGGYAGYQVRFGENTIDLAASFNSASGHYSSGINSMYAWAGSAVVNYFRDFLKYGTFGFEAIFGRRHNIDASTSGNTRIYLYLRYNF